MAEVLNKKINKIIINKKIIIKIIRNNNKKIKNKLKTN